MNEREKRKLGVLKDTTFNGAKRDRFMAMEVPRQCPSILLVKVD
jgi:hypothetical protein